MFSYTFAAFKASSATILVALNCLKEQQYSPIFYLLLCEYCQYCTKLFITNATYLSSLSARLLRSSAWSCADSSRGFTEGMFCSNNPPLAISFSLISINSPLKPTHSWIINKLYFTWWQLFTHNYVWKFINYTILFSKNSGDNEILAKKRISFLCSICFCIYAFCFELKH